MDNRNIIWKIITVIILQEIILIAPVISSFTNTVIIKSTGEISTSYIVARSGSPADVQAAVDTVAAAGGGTVYIPAGNFTFDFSGYYGVIVYGGVNVIGAGADKTILRETRNPPTGSIMFYLDGSNGKPIRISGIFFKGYVGTSEDYSNKAIEVDGVKDYRIDHCRFEDFSSHAIGASGQHRGVVDHCDFDNPYKFTLIDAAWGYGIIVWGDEQTWNSIDWYLGQYDGKYNIMYIEDCTFTRCRHSIAGNAGGFYVVRYCVFTNPNPENFGIIDVHGLIGGGGIGGRGLEAYNNVIVGATGYDYSQAFWLRGGGGVVYNNEMQNIWYGVGLYLEEGQQQKCKLHDLWVWENGMDRGTLINNAGGFTQNVDYFLYAKSGYTPYPYPHPLTLQTPP